MGSSHHQGTLLTATPSTRGQRNKATWQEEDAREHAALCARHVRAARVSDLGWMYTVGAWVGIWSRNPGGCTHSPLWQPVWIFLLFQTLLLIRAILLSRYAFKGAPEADTDDLTKSILVDQVYMAIYISAYVAAVPFFGPRHKSPHERAKIGLWKEAQAVSYGDNLAEMDLEFGDSDSSRGDNDDERNRREERGAQQSADSGGLSCSLFSFCGAHEHESTFTEIVSLVRPDQAARIGMVVALWLAVVPIIATSAVFTTRELEARDWNRVPHWLYPIECFLKLGAYCIACVSGMYVVAPIIAAPLFVSLRVRDIANDIRSRSVSDHLQFSVAQLEYEYASVHRFFDVTINKRLYRFTAFLAFLIFASTGFLVVTLLITPEFFMLSFLFFTLAILLIIILPYAIANASLASISKAVIEERGELAVVLHKSWEARNQRAASPELVDLAREMDSFILLVTSLESSKVSFANIPITFGLIKALVIAATSFFTFFIPLVFTS